MENLPAQIAQLQVDPNLSQLGLTQLKLHLLEHCSIKERLSILGHQKMPIQDRRA